MLLRLLAQLVLGAGIVVATIVGMARGWRRLAETARARPALASVIALGSLVWLSLFSLVADVSLLAPLLIGATAAGLHASDRARARGVLEDAVLRRWSGATGPTKRPILPVGRTASLVSLADAFAAMRRGDVTLALTAASRVDRGDLSAWEMRVLDAVRALACLATGDGVRAAQLAPLALPTRNEGVDRTLAGAMIRSAWDDGPRLAAIGAALDAAGPHLAGLSLVCELRGRQLAGLALEPSDEARSRWVRAADDARAIGEEPFADRMLQAASSRGTYR